MMKVVGLLLAVCLVYSADPPKIQETHHASYHDHPIPVGGSKLSAFTHSSHGQVSLEKILQDRVMVLAPSSGVQLGGHSRLLLTGYYAVHGLRSIADNENFLPLNLLLRESEELAGLLFHTNTEENAQFFENKIEKFVLPDNYRILDLIDEIKMMSRSDFPIIYVAPKWIFERHHFVGIEEVTKFVINDYFIELDTTHDSTVNFTTFGTETDSELDYNPQDDIPSNFASEYTPVYVEEALFRVYRSAKPLKVGKEKKP